MPARTPTRRLLPLIGVMTLIACAPLEEPAGRDAGVDAGPSATVSASTPPVAEAAPIAEHSQAIHAEPTFDNCTAQQQVALRAALTHARARVQSADYRACLGDAFGVEDEGHMVEDLVADTNTLRSIEFRCRPGEPWAQAFGDDHNEWMNIFGDIATRESTESMAAILVHEVTHNHYWDHYTFYGPTWPDQVQSCVFRGQPFGARRSQLVGPRTLNHAGGDGGVERQLRCGSDEAMVGITGALAVNGRLVRLQPLCQDVEGDARIGNPWNFAMSLPAGAARFEDRCPAGYGVIGLEGSAHRYVERIRAVCGELGDLRAMSGFVSTRNRPYRGWLSGRGFIRHCPARTVATGMVVRTGGLVDGFELGCDDFPLQNRGPGAYRGAHGGAGGRAETRRCPGTMALVGVWGQWSMASGTLATMGGRCMPVSEHGVPPDMGWGRSVAFTEHAGAVQPTEDDAILRVSNCAPDEVLVGLDVAADRFVGDMAAVCADADGWLAGDDTVRLANMPRRRPGETVRRIMCAQGDVGVALSLRVGSLVDRAGLRCSAPATTGSVRHMPAVGGNAGRGFEDICPEGRAMVGFTAEVGAGVLRNVVGRCGRPTDDGTSVVSPVFAATVRGTAAPDTVDDCALGQVMIGIGVGYGNTHVEWVSGICADEDSVRDGAEPANVGYTRWRGRTRNLHTFTDLRCPNGEVVRGLHGTRAPDGAEYDATRSLAPVCGKATLYPGSDVPGSASFLRAEVHPLIVPTDFAGRLRLRVSTAHYVQPRIRLRRGAAPTANRYDFELEGANGWADLMVDDLRPGQWFVEVGVHGGVGGIYRLRADGI